VTEFNMVGLLYPAQDGYYRVRVMTKGEGEEFDTEELVLTVHDLERLRARTLSLEKRWPFYLALTLARGSLKGWKAWLYRRLF
jgi:hypothetical protein